MTSATPEQDKTVRLTQALLRVASVTPLDAKDLPAAQGVIDVAAEAAQGSGATVERLSFEGGHEKWGYKVENLYAEWTFGTPDDGRPARHICYIGHLDVVPPGDVASWSKEPFSGAVKDGYVHGRGVTDMKGSVAAFLDAVAELKAEGNVRVSMILTTDEEWAAVNGTNKVLDWMKSQGKTPDAFIIGEPSSQDDLGSHIKTGRRGSLVGTLVSRGTQGHAAYRELFDNPNRGLLLAAAILSALRWDDGNDHFPSTNFETVALKSGDFNASAIIPAEAQALWNIRYTPSETPESLERKLKDALANPPDWAKAHPDYLRLKDIEVRANKDTASLPYYSAPAGLAAAAKAAVRDVLGREAVLDGSGGATDGRFAAKAFPTAEIIELGLPERGGIAKGKADDYLSRGGMHQVDERASVRDLINLRRIFAATLKNYERQAPRVRNDKLPPAPPRPR